MGSGKSKKSVWLSGEDCDLIVRTTNYSPSIRIGKLNVRVYDRTYVILEISKRAKPRKLCCKWSSPQKIPPPRLVGAQKPFAPDRKRRRPARQGRRRNATGTGQAPHFQTLHPRTFDQKAPPNAEKTPEETKMKMSLPRGYTNSGKSSTLNALLIIQWRREEVLKKTCFSPPSKRPAAHKNGGQFIFPRNRHCRIREQTPHHLQF